MSSPAKDFNTQKISECSSPNPKYHKTSLQLKSSTDHFHCFSTWACRGVTYLPQLLQSTQNWFLQLRAPFPEEPQPRVEGQHWAQDVLSCSKEKQYLSSFPTLHLLSLLLRHRYLGKKIKEYSIHISRLTLGKTVIPEKIRPRVAMFLPSLLLLSFLYPCRSFQLMTLYNVWFLDRTTAFLNFGSVWSDIFSFVFAWKS